MRFAVLLSLSASALLAQSAMPFRIGVCTHFGQAKGYLPANVSVIKQAGADFIRDEVGWGGVERTKGELVAPAFADTFVDASIKAGLQPMLILDYGNRFYDKGDKPLSEEAIEGFVRYSEFMVKHFRGRVKLWEVWNEWDISIGGTSPGSAESYTKLLARVYPRIKAVEPSIIVMGGAMTSGGIARGWLEGMLKADALKSLDEVSVHTYNYSDTGRSRTPEAWAESMNKVQDMLRKYSGGKDVPLNVTEMGWPTQIDRRGTPPEISAAYLTRMYLLARTMSWMKGVWWYDFQDDGWRHAYNENNFGIVRPDLTPKPGYWALKDLGTFLSTARYAGRVETKDPEIWILRFRTAAGADAWALWSTHEDDGWQVTFRSSRPRPAPLTVREAGRGSFERPWGGRTGDDRASEAAPDRTDLVVRETPWIITGDLADVTVTEVRRREFPELIRTLQVLR